MKIADIRHVLKRLDHVAPLEGERYAACLETYEAASNQRERILAWFKDNVIPALSRERAWILSVGCGAGDLDKEILAAGAEHASAVAYFGLEPNARQCERFISRMGFENNRNIRVEAHNIGFDAFNENRRFDLVLMVHSLYYMADPKLALENALGLVNDEGRLAVLIASNDTLNELASSFWGLENERLTWFSEDLSEHLDKVGVPFECKRIEATLDVTACCEPDSERGIRIADFLAQVPTGQLPERLRHMIFNYVDETSHRDGEKRWLPHNVDAFTIESKPKGST